jgi:hypothetical protein
MEPYSKEVLPVLIAIEHFHRDEIIQFKNCKKESYKKIIIQKEPLVHSGINK